MQNLVDAFTEFQVAYDDLESSLNDLPPDKAGILKKVNAAIDQFPSDLLDREDEIKDFGGPILTVGG